MPAAAVARGRRSHYAGTMSEDELLVAISIDIPPYVMEDASRGLEVEIVRRALAGRALRFFQIPYEELQGAIGAGRADVSVGVQEADDGVHYSGNFVTFANAAISKKADDLRIDAIADLAGHRVLTWQNADLELGEEFEKLFSPRSAGRVNYIEVADQEDQVRNFWAEHGAVAVIDCSIFIHFTKAMGHSMDEVTVHHLFPPVTHFRVGFKEATVRDAFDRGISRLCDEGGYAELLRRYDIPERLSICGEGQARASSRKTS
jgi:polar amino acid transport system substrate-binding protein